MGQEDIGHKGTFNTVGQKDISSKDNNLNKLSMFENPELNVGER